MKNGFFILGFSKLFFLCLSLLWFLQNTVSSQELEVEQEVEEIVVDEGNSFLYSAQSLDAVVTEGKERIVLQDQAFIQSKDTIISANSLIIYGKDYRFVVAEGAVIIYDQKQEIRITSNAAFFDRETEVAKVVGYFSLEDAQNELILRANYLENDGKNNTFKAQIGVKLLKEDLIARCDYASYSRDTKIFTLSGNPSLYYQGDDYHADIISVNTDTDKIQLLGNVEGTVFVGD